MDQVCPLRQLYSREVCAWLVGKCAFWAWFLGSLVMLIVPWRVGISLFFFSKSFAKPSTVMTLLGEEQGIYDPVWTRVIPELDGRPLVEAANVAPLESGCLVALTSLWSEAALQSMPESHQDVALVVALAKCMSEFTQPIGNQVFIDPRLNPLAAEEDPELAKDMEEPSDHVAFLTTARNGGKSPPWLRQRVRHLMSGFPALPNQTAMRFSPQYPSAIITGFDDDALGCV